MPRDSRMAAPFSALTMRRRYIWRPTLDDVLVGHLLPLNTCTWKLNDVDIGHSATVIWRRDFKPYELRFFADRIAISAALQDLSLASVHLGSEAATTLAVGLARNHTLLRVDLQNTAIGAIGAACVADALTGHPTLESLDLSWNWKDSAAVAASLRERVSRIDAAVAERREKARRLAEERRNRLLELARGGGQRADDLEDHVGADVFEEAEVEEEEASVSDMGSALVEGDADDDDAHSAATPPGKLALLRGKVARGLAAMRSSGAESDDDGSEDELVRRPLRRKDTKPFIEVKPVAPGEGESEGDPDDDEEFVGDDDEQGGAFDFGAREDGEALRLYFGRLDVTAVSDNAEFVVEKLVQLINGVTAVGDGSLARTGTPCLSTLQLRGNHLSATEVTALASGMRTSQSLTSLGLRWNGLSDDGGLALAAALSAQPFPLLSSIDVGEHCLGSKGVRALCFAARVNSTITALDLGCGDPDFRGNGYATPDVIYLGGSATDPTRPPEADADLHRRWAAKEPEPGRLHMAIEEYADPAMIVAVTNHQAEEDWGDVREAKKQAAIEARLAKRRAKEELKRKAEAKVREAYVTELVSAPSSDSDADDDGSGGAEATDRKAAGAGNAAAGETASVSGSRAASTRTKQSSVAPEVAAELESSDSEIEDIAEDDDAVSWSDYKFRDREESTDSRDGIGALGAEGVAYVCRRSAALQSLTLTNAGMDERQCALLFSALASNPQSLTSLDLSFVPSAHPAVPRSRGLDEVMLRQQTRITGTRALRALNRYLRLTNKLTNLRCVGLTSSGGMHAI